MANHQLDPITGLPEKKINSNTIDPKTGLSQETLEYFNFTRKQEKLRFNPYDTSLGEAESFTDEEYKSFTKRGIDPGRAGKELATEFRAERQGSGESIFNGLVGGTAMTATRIVGGIGDIAIAVPTLIAAAATQDASKLETIFDNPFSNGIKDIENSIRETLPIYNTKGDEAKNFLHRALTDLDYWTDDLIREGGSFLASAYLTGMGASKLLSPLTKSLYASKLTKAAQLAEAEVAASGLTGGAADKLYKTALALQKSGLSKNIANAHQWTIAGTVRSIESIAEGEQTYDAVYKDLIDKGRDPEYAKLEAAKAAMATTGLNMLLMPLEYMQTGAWMKTFSGLKRASRTELLKETAKGLAPKMGGALKEFGKTVGEQAISEGILEEGLQKAFQDYTTKKYTGKYEDNELNPIASIMEEYIKGFGTKEGWDAMGAGMILGGLFGGGAGIYTNKTKEEKLNTLKKAIADNKFLKNDLSSFIDTSTGKPLINKAKVIETIQQSANFQNLEKGKQQALLNNYEEAFKAIDNIQFADWAFSHFEAGMGERLFKQIDEMKGYDDKKLEELGLSVKELKNSQGKEITASELSDRYRQKAIELEEMYNDIADRFDATPKDKRAILDEAVIQQETIKSIETINSKIEKGISKINTTKRTRNTDFKEIESLEDIVKDKDSNSIVKTWASEMIAKRKDLLNTLKDSNDRTDKLTNPEALKKNKKATTLEETETPKTTIEDIDTSTDKEEAARKYYLEATDIDDLNERVKKIKAKYPQEFLAKIQGTYDQVYNQLKNRPTEPEPPTSIDIKAKKADIERRRQESINGYTDEEGEFNGIKQFTKEQKENLDELGISTKSIIGEWEGFYLQPDITGKLGEDSENVIEYIKGKTKQEVKDKINAKYDAELDALKTKPPTPPTPTPGPVEDEDPFKSDEEIEEIKKRGTSSEPEEDERDTVEDSDTINTNELTNTPGKGYSSDRLKITEYGENMGVDDKHSPFIQANYEYRDFYEEIPADEREGHKFLVVTKQSHPTVEGKKGLYDQILDQEANDFVKIVTEFDDDPKSSKEFEEQYKRDNKKEYDKGIWLVLVDEKGKPITHKGYLIASTLESAYRIEEKKIIPEKVYEHLQSKGKGETIDATTETLIANAKVALNNFRNELLKPSDKPKYLPIAYLSNGLTSGLKEDPDFSAFEKRDENNERVVKNVIGRITEKTDLSDTDLYIPTSKEEGNTGKLYIIENGKRIDLIQRKLNDTEIDKIISLIDEHINSGGNTQEFIVEIKKLIFFKRESKAHMKKYQMYFDGITLHYGETGIMQGVNPEILKNFLQTKRINANTKYLNKRFTNPLTSKPDYSYNQFLLEGENPMFGTDLKTMYEESGERRRRYKQRYFVYKPEAFPNALSDKTTDVKTEDGIAVLPDEEFKEGGLFRLVSVVDESTLKTPISEEERKWHEEYFPNTPIQTSVEITRKLKAEGAFAKVLSSARVIQLSDEAPTGTLYHEGFHDVTQYSLTEKETKSLYNEARQRLGLPKASDLEIEEKLAEDYANYRRTGKILRNAPKRNVFFRRIANFIKDLLGLSPTNIQHLYKRLDTGFYKNAKVIDKPRFSSLHRDQLEKDITETKGTKFVKEALDGIHVMFFKFLYDNQKTPIAALNKKNVDIILHSKGGVKNQIDTKYREAFAKKDPIANEYAYILTNWKGFVSLWTKKANTLGLALEVREKESDENKRGGDAFQEDFSVSLESQMSNPIRMLISSLKSGEVNELGFQEPVNFKSTYRFLSVNLQGVGSSFKDLHAKLTELAKKYPNKPELTDLLTIIGKPGEEILSNEKQNFKTAFLQDFNKYKYTNWRTFFKPNGVIDIVDATRQVETETLRQKWSENIVGLFTQNDQGRNVISKEVLDSSITHSIDKLALDLQIKFLDKIGITLSEETKAIIRDSRFNKSEFTQSVAWIKTYLTETEGDITNLITKEKKLSKKEEGEKGSKIKSDVAGRIEYLLDLEAEYTSNIESLQFITAENKTQHSIGDNNTLTVLANDMNNSTDLEDLKRRLPHLNNDTIKESFWINEMFNSDGTRNKEVSIKIELANGLNTSADIKEQSHNIITRRGTIGDLLTQSANTILQRGKSSLIVSADGTSEFLISLNKYANGERIPVSIDFFKDKFYSEDKVPSEKYNRLKAIFGRYYAAEVRRLVRFKFGEGENTDIYNKNGKNWTILNDYVSANTKDIVKKKIDSLTSYNKEEVEKLIKETTPAFEDSLMKGLSAYEREFTNKLEEHGIEDPFSTELNSKFDRDQLIRAVISNDLINQIEQTNLFLGNLAYYKDIYKRAKLFAGTKLMPRVDEDMNEHLNSMHKRSDGKLADGFENATIFEDIKVEKKVGDRYDEYTESDSGGAGTTDFFIEFLKRTTGLTDSQQKALELARDGKLSTKLVSKEDLEWVHTLKLQYSGPKYDKNGVLQPGTHKYTVMHIYPQMIAGKNLEKIVARMKEAKSGLYLFKSAAKFGATVNPETGKTNKFYENYNHGNISEEPLITQRISYKYLGLQVQSSKPKHNYIFSTQFRKTAFINSFINGIASIKEATELFKQFNDAINETVKRAKEKLIKELGFNDKLKLEDVTKLVELLQKEAEDRSLPNNLIDALDQEIINGEKIKDQLRFKIDSFVNKAKVDSMIMAITESRLIKQKFNGDAYVLAPVTGFESGYREIGTNKALNVYGIDPKTGKTTPAGCMIPMSEAYYPLLRKYGTVEGVNQAIKEDKIKDEILQLVGCRIPGQGMNSNEFLQIAEFLPELSSTTMVIHPELVPKSGADYDNDKLYTYRPNIALLNGEVVIVTKNNYKQIAQEQSLEDKTKTIEELEDKLLSGALENQATNSIKEILRHKDNHKALITPNSTDLYDDIVNELMYDEYVEEKLKEGKKTKDILPLTSKDKEELTWLKEQKNVTPVINYSKLTKLHNKIEARFKLWLAKDEVAISANMNAFIPLSQIAGLTANASYNTYDSIGRKIENIARVGLPTNMLNGKINLGAQTHTGKETTISDAESQRLNLELDAAKKDTPEIYYLNMTDATLSVYSWLNITGTPIDVQAAFMTQPILKKMSEIRNKRNTIKNKLEGKYTFDSAKEDYKKIIADILKIPFATKNDRIKNGTKINKYIANKLETETYKDKVYSLEELKAFKNPNVVKDEAFALAQLQILNDFNAYKTQSRFLSDIISYVGIDSSGLGKDLNQSRLRLELRKKIDKAGFINGLDNLINSTFIKSFMQDQFVIDTFSQLYNIQSNEELINNLINLFNIIEINANNAVKVEEGYGEEPKVTKEPVFLNADDKDKILTLLENDFIDYVVQNYGYIDNQRLSNIDVVRKKLLTSDKTIGKQSIADKLIALKVKAKEGTLTDNEKQLTDNLFIQKLYAVKGKAEEGWDNLRIFAKRIDKFESDQLTESLRELKSINKEWYSEITHTGIIQSGLNNSAITYLGLIPYEDYNNLVKKAFERFEKANDETDFNKFEQLFIKNNKESNKFIKITANKLGLSKLGHNQYGKDYSKINVKQSQTTTSTQQSKPETKYQTETTASESLEEGIEWAKEAMPNAPIELINGLVDNIATGSYNSAEDLIQASIEFANKGTIKHEIGHRAFAMLSKDEQNKLLDEGSKKYDITGDLAIEERIMEDMAKSKDEIKPTTAIGKFFKMVKNFLRDLFKVRDKVEKFIEDINAGKFAGMKPVKGEGVKYETNQKTEKSKETIPETEETIVFKNLIKKISEVLHKQKSIYKQRKSSKKLIEDIEAIEKLISENKNELDAINKFIDDADIYTTKSEIRLNKLKKLLSSKELTEKESAEALASIDEIKEFVSAYSILNDIRKVMHIEGASGIDIYSKEINAAIVRRDIILEDYKTLGQDLIVDWLYQQAESTNENLKRQGKDKFILTKEKLKEELKMASSDIGLLNSLLGSVINSKDPVSALVAKAIKELLEEARVKDIETKETLLTEYDKVEGNKNNVKAFNAKYIHTILNYEKTGEDADGNEIWKEVERDAFVTEFYTDKFKKAKREFYNSIGKRPNEDDKKAYELWNKKVATWFNENTQVDELKVQRLIKEKQAKLSPEEFENWLNSNLKEVENTQYYSSEKIDYIDKSKVFSTSTNKKIIYLYSGEFLSPAEKYRNKKYDELSKSSYYQELLRTYNEANALRPEKSRLKHGIIPQARKNGRDRIYEAGFDISNQTEALKSGIKDATTFQVTDKEYGLGRLSGEEFKRIPLYYNTLINKEDLSYDLLESVLKFSQESNKYDALHKIEPNIRVLKDLIKERDVTKTNATGKQLLDLVNKNPLSKTDAKRVNERLIEFIDSVYYGEEIVKESFAFMGKEYSIDKIANKLQFFNAISLMAGNFTSAINNTLWGNLQAFNESAGGKYYNKSDWGNALIEYSKNLPQFMNDLSIRFGKSKVTQLIELYDAIQGEYRDQYGNNISGTNAKRLFSTDSLFFTSNGTEHQIQVTGLIAMMKAKKLTKKNGETISLFDAYEVKDNKLKLKDDVKWSEKDRFEFMNQLHKINKELHGNYNTFDKSSIQRKWYGQLALGFRKYIYTSFVRRYGSEQIDYEVMDVTEGYYRVFAKKFINDLQKYKFNILLYAQNMTPEQKVAFRKTMVDIVALTAIVMITGAMAGGDDDDRKKNSWFYNQSLLQLRRLEADFKFYLPIPNSDQWRILKTPAVSMSTIERTVGFFDQALPWNITEVYERRSGLNEKGDNKAYAKFKKLIPIYRQIENFVTPEEQIKIYSKK